MALDGLGVARTGKDACYITPFHRICLYTGIPRGMLHNDVTCNGHTRPPVTTQSVTGNGCNGGLGYPVIRRILFTMVN